MLVSHLLRGRGSRFLGDAVLPFSCWGLELRSFPLKDCGLRSVIDTCVGVWD